MRTAPLTSPASGRIAGVVCAVAAAAVLAGCSGSSGAGSGEVTVTQTVTEPPTTSSPPSGSPTSAAATPTNTPKPLQTSATAVAAPWKDKNADFGFVLSAKVVSGGVQITFDRATWLLADQVKAWNAAHPSAKVTPTDDYAIANQSKLKRVFLVRTGAAIYGSILLSDQPDPKRITLAQFAARINANPTGVTCWLYHRYGGLDGDVIEVQEQYRP